MLINRITLVTVSLASLIAADAPIPTPMSSAALMFDSSPIPGSDSVPYPVSIAPTTAESESAPDSTGSVADSAMGPIPAGDNDDQMKKDIKEKKKRRRKKRKRKTTD